MTCIIIDDEPLAREAIEMLIEQQPELELLACCNDPVAASSIFKQHKVDVVFLDIQMPGMTGLEFAALIPPETMIIFTTAYAHYALDSYVVDAIDYLLKPIKPERFHKAVQKAADYKKLLEQSTQNDVKSLTDEYVFVKADRKFFKIFFRDIAFVEALKDYVVLHVDGKKIMTAMNLKTVYDKLPKSDFVRISRSFVVNIKHITSIDNNMVFIGTEELPIGNSYRNYFFDEIVTTRLMSR